MKKPIMFRTVLTFLLISLLSLPAGSQEIVHQFTKGFSSKLKGRYGREAVFQDSILYSIAGSKWQKPQKEEGNTENSWDSIESNDKGVFRNQNLRGGYLYCEYESKRNEALVLEVSGHNEVFVNGEPRGGDVYNYSWVQHPVRIKKGINSFLFRGSRGQIKAALVKPPAEVFLSNRDMLVPDWVKGDADAVFGALRVINLTDKELTGYKIQSKINGEDNVMKEIPSIPPLSSRKVPFYIDGSSFDMDNSLMVSLELLNSSGRSINGAGVSDIVVSVKGQTDKRKVTFFSEIDGSVQYYSLVPSSDPENSNPALFLSLHGASVEAVNQAGAYSPKDWGVLVAPTNRRPYGFDWEDWGRMDALEVLNIAREKYNPDPDRTYLTGHSMGGHGTWQFGVNFPDAWAAIAPSAGWYSFWSYAGKEENTDPDPVEKIFMRASNPSNTLGLSRNYLHYGIYVLHGDKDDNVPVSQAREMREHLSTYHPDFCYYERPGAGHWWGNECVDWPPLFDFFRNHQRQAAAELKEIDFSTASPGISATSRFISVWQQEEDLEISNVRVSQNIDAKLIKISSDNVRTLRLDLGHLQKGQPFEVICDTDSFKVDPSIGEIYIRKEEMNWVLIDEPSTSEKGPHRYGMFKEAFQNRMVFVYGTEGNKEEDEWAYNKARFDAETFWYRGNGAVDVVSDKNFINGDYQGRNVILYGHSEMNSAWDYVLEGAPVIPGRGSVKVGGEVIEGGDISVNFVYPRKGSTNCSVAVIAGTGKSGMISAYPNRYFVSGAGYPDYLVYRSDMLEKGKSAVLKAGFFDHNWKINQR